MLIKIGGEFHVDDYFVDNNNLTIVTNVKPDFNILRKCGSLIVNNETKGLMKTAKLVTVVPKSSDFLYIRNRAVSAGNVIDKEDGYAELIPIDKFYKDFDKYDAICRGANDNGDFFSDEELQNCYKTFIHKAVFVDHDNENVEKARGIILDAVYNTRGRYVELLKAVDRKAYPELARAIEMSYVNSTSMGCRCGYSICSICHNEAKTEEDFCDHIINYKGLTFNGNHVFEDNRDVEFIEDSFVSVGADPDAKVLERVASRNGKSRLKKRRISTPMNNILSEEQNQRTYSGQVNSIFNQLKDLPWT